jgi:cytochrome c peroxidase
MALVPALPDLQLCHLEITAEQVAQAIASFERTLIAGNSAFDRYLFGRDRKALTQSETRGMRLFRRKGNCANCHEII